MERFYVARFKNSTYSFKPTTQALVDYFPTFLKSVTKIQDELARYECHY